MRANKKSLVCVSVLATLVASGCDLPSGPLGVGGKDPWEVTLTGGFDFVGRVVIEPDTLRLVIGETGELSATAYMSPSGEEAGLVDLYWTASDTTIVGLSSEQLRSDEPLEVTARMPGKALVVVSNGRPELCPNCSFVVDTAVVLVR